MEMGKGCETGRKRLRGEVDVVQLEECECGSRQLDVAREARPDELLAVPYVFERTQVKASESGRVDMGQEVVEIGGPIQRECGEIRERDHTFQVSLIRAHTREAWTE